MLTILKYKVIRPIVIKVVQSIFYFITLVSFGPDKNHKIIKLKVNFVHFIVLLTY